MNSPYTICSDCVSRPKIAPISCGQNKLSFDCGDYNQNCLDPNYGSITTDPRPYMPQFTTNNARKAQALKYMHVEDEST